MRFDTGKRLPDACFLAIGKHFSFFFTITKVVVVLHADKLGPPILLSDMLKSEELVSVHRRCANITDLAHGNEICKLGQSLSATYHAGLSLFPHVEYQDRNGESGGRRHTPYQAV